MTIELDNVRFAYPQAPEKIILNIRDWSVAAGERLFIHGPSGCGKSTLLNLLSGMIFTSQGKVSVLGEPLNQMTNRQRDRFRANHIGYVFQQFNLVPYLNAVDNIQLASYFSRRKTAGGETASRKTESASNTIEALLSRLGIASSDWRKPAASLSIGQQQRVAIARALINRPGLLIADEPTSSLDQDNRDNFMSILMSLADEYKMTLLFVSHDISLSSGFDRAVALSDFNQQEKTG